MHICTYVYMCMCIYVYEREVFFWSSLGGRKTQLLGFPVRIRPGTNAKDVTAFPPIPSHPQYLLDFHITILF